MPVEFGHVTPVLRVASLETGLAYYRDALGFQVQWADRGFASVARGRASLMLSEGDQGRAGTWIYVGVSDADALYDELRARGATIRHPPTNYPWGARELHVSDPDGHVLRFGADARPGEPIGEWLDGEGHRWLPQQDGSWRRADEPEPGPASLDAVVAAPAHHAVLLENDHVRVLDTRIAPGDTVPLHAHRWPSVLHVVSSSDFVRRDEEGAVVLDSRAAGITPPTVAWSPPLPPHTLENVGSAEIRVVAVEIKDAVR